MPSFEARVTSVLNPYEGAAYLTHFSLPGTAAFTILLSGFALPALAMDCGKATSPTDKAICADPAASAADEAMAAAYASLYGNSSETDKKKLLQSQRTWLKLRTSECIEDKKLSAKCLVDFTQRRSLYLQGKPETGPGTGHDLIPVIIAQTGTAKLYELDIVAAKFPAPVLPGETLFNTEVDKLLKEAPSSKEKGGQPDMTYIYDLHLRVTYASPGFLSASVDSYLFSGGAHGNSGTSSINIDIAKGKDLTFADDFDETAHKKLGDLCFAQIKAQKQENETDLNEGLLTIEELRKTIDDGVSSMKRWSFSETQGVVTFDPYALGSYIEGSYNCTFSTEVLQPLYKAGNILPRVLY
jgi:uncharacterized protein YecT (DUF1311 family)